MTGEEIMRTIPIFRSPHKTQAFFKTAFDSNINVDSELQQYIYETLALRNNVGQPIWHIYRPAQHSFVLLQPLSPG